MAVFQIATDAPSLKTSVNDLADFLLPSALDARQQSEAAYRGLSDAFATNAGKSCHTVACLRDQEQAKCHCAGLTDTGIPEVEDCLMRSPRQLTGVATGLRKIAGHVQGCADGKNLIENSLCGNQLRHLMAAISVVFRDADAFRTAS